MVKQNIVDSKIMTLIKLFSYFFTKKRANINIIMVLFYIKIRLKTVVLSSIFDTQNILHGTSPKFHFSKNIFIL